MKGGLQQYLVPVIGLAVAFGVFIGLMWIEGLYVLPANVSLPAEWNEQFPEWLAGFKVAEQEWILYPALILAIIWFCICWARPSYEGDNRIAWWLLWAVQAAVGVLCIVIEKLQLDVSLVPELLTLANAVLLFWIATALFTPITHKFAPVGSDLRKW